MGLGPHSSGRRTYDAHHHLGDAAPPLDLGQDQNAVGLGQCQGARVA